MKRMPFCAERSFNPFKVRSKPASAKSKGGVDRNPVSIPSRYDPNILYPEAHSSASGVSIPSRYDPNKTLCCLPPYRIPVFQSLQGTIQTRAGRRNSASRRAGFNPFKVRSKQTSEWETPQDLFDVSIPSRYDPNTAPMRLIDRYLFVSIPSRYDPNTFPNFVISYDLNAFQSLQGTIQTKRRKTKTIKTKPGFNPFKVRSKRWVLDILFGMVYMFQSLQGTIQTKTCTDIWRRYHRLFQSLQGTIQTGYLAKTTFKITIKFQSLQGTIQTRMWATPMLTGLLFQSLQGTTQTQTSKG